MRSWSSTAIPITVRSSSTRSASSATSRTSCLSQSRSRWQVEALKLSSLVLGRRASFWVSAGVVTHIFWTSAAPAMTYRLYAEQWHLTATVTTGIFAVYPIVVVAVLVGFGDLSDHIGRRLVMLLGLAASLIGTLLFAVAPDVLWLFAGRALAGVGVG